MKRNWLKIAAIGLWVMLATGVCWGAAKPEPPKLAVQFANMVMEKWPDPTAIDSNGWEYNSSIVLVGIEQVYLKTKDPKYLKYIQKWVDYFIDDRGNVKFNKEANNLDHLHPGLLLLFLYEQTGQDRYKKAAMTIRREFDNQPRNAEGGFWHKQQYPNEMWADGIYMAEPFLIKYGKLFGDREYCDNEASFQAVLFASHAQDPKTGLLYHGWDQDRNAAWADPRTGLSNVIWCRAMGWYMMALVEILDDLPRTHPRYQTLRTILTKAAAGLKQVQYPVSGLWFQVLDQSYRASNWWETSGSAMMVYVLKHAVDQGYLDESYRAVAAKGWEGVKTRVSYDELGQPVINGAVQGMGVQVNFENYVNKKRLINSTHGLCGVMLAGSVMEF